MAACSFASIPVRPPGSWCGPPGAWPKPPGLSGLRSTWKPLAITPRFEDQERIAKTMRLAAQLGGQTVMLSGFSLRDTILDFVREQGVI